MVRVRVGILIRVTEENCYSDACMNIWPIWSSIYDAFDISLSVYNITNEEPPFVGWEMNYDPYVHSPLGRYFKAGFTYRMQ